MFFIGQLWVLLAASHAMPDMTNDIDGGVGWRGGSVIACGAGHTQTHTRHTQQTCQTCSCASLLDVHLSSRINTTTIPLSDNTRRGKECHQQHLSASWPQITNSGRHHSVQDVQVMSETAGYAKTREAASLQSCTANRFKQTASEHTQMFSACTRSSSPNDDEETGRLFDKNFKTSVRSISARV